MTFQKIVIRALIFLLENCRYSNRVTNGEVNHLIRELESFK